MISGRGEGSPLGGESVLLEAALGLVGNGHLDEAGGERGSQVGQAEVLVVLEPQRILEFLPAGGFFQDGKQARDFRGDS